MFYLKETLVIQVMKPSYLIKEDEATNMERVHYMREQALFVARLDWQRRWGIKTLQTN